MPAAGVNFAAWLLERGEPAAVAIIDRERVFTYDQLRAHVRAIAAMVRRHTAATAQRSPILILGENSFELVATYLGVLCAGEIATPLSPMSSLALDSVVSQTGARLAFCDERYRPTIADRVAHTLPLGAGIDGDSGAPAELASTALAAVMYTSGSTGDPRGVMLSPRNLIANTNAILAFWPRTPADRALLSMPMYYCYGASIVHTHLRSGASVVMTQDHYPEPLLDTLERTRATSLPNVPSVFDLLLARSTLARRQLPHLASVMVSGGRLHDASVRRLREVLPAATVYVRYGVTELTAAASWLPPEQLDHKLGSIGTGLPGLPLAVLTASGDPVRPGSGEVGEIVARGDHVAMGYLGDAAETSRAFRDGAYFTGDLATVDADGYIFIAGRGKEFVKSGGHRISPQEIEQVIARCPGVAQTGVCGIVHSTRGELLVAAVVVAPGQQLSAGDIRAHCLRSLPGFKVPAWVELMDALPMTATGKLDRVALRDSITPLVKLRR